VLVFAPPPQTIIKSPVQIAVCHEREAGALVMVVGVQPSVSGSYRPPVFDPPPQTTILLPVQTAVW
jgi:hypothetical protein